MFVEKVKKTAVEHLGNLLVIKKIVLGWIFFKMLKKGKEREKRETSKLFRLWLCIHVALKNPRNYTIAWKLLIEFMKHLPSLLVYNRKRVCLIRMKIVWCATFDMTLWRNNRHTLQVFNKQFNHGEILLYK